MSRYWCAVRSASRCATDKCPAGFVSSRCHTKATITRTLALLRPQRCRHPPANDLAVLPYITTLLFPSVTLANSARDSDRPRRRATLVELSSQGIQRLKLTQADTSLPSRKPIPGCWTVRIASLGHLQRAACCGVDRIDRHSPCTDAKPSTAPHVRGDVQDTCHRVVKGDMARAGRRPPKASLSQLLWYNGKDTRQFQRDVLFGTHKMEVLLFLESTARKRVFFAMRAHCSQVQLGFVCAGSSPRARAQFQVSPSNRLQSSLPHSRNDHTQALHSQELHMGRWSSPPSSLSAVPTSAPTHSLVNGARRRVCFFLGGA